MQHTMVLDIPWLRCRRFRKPKHSYQHHKSEVASRHSAFTRGSAYLERYCLLIAFGAYLEEVTAGMPGGLAAWQGDTLPSFADWLDARPELYQVGTTCLCC